MKMILNKMKPVFYLILVVGTCYIIHKFSFYLFDLKLLTANFELEELYLMFGVLSASIISILIKIKQKNIDLVGNVFLLTTGIKMTFCFIFMRSSMEVSKTNQELDKWNFLILFMIFLITETVFAIQLLNSKD